MTAKNLQTVGSKGPLPSALPTSSDERGSGSVAAPCSPPPIFVELEGYRIETWTEENKLENAKRQLAGWRLLGSPQCESITPISKENQSDSGA